MKAAIRTGWTGLTLSFSSNYPEPLETNLKPDEVIVNVKAAAINPVDYKIPLKLLGPVYGLDFSGTIASLGPSSSSPSKFQVGDAVFGKCKGSLAEQSISNINEISHKPDFLSFEEAAALPVAYLSGLQALRDNGGIDMSSDNIGDDGNKSKSVLIIGASGGCGIAALQLLKGMNNEPSDVKISRVVAVCSNKNSDFVRKNGATEVVDYTNKKELDFFFKENEGKFDCVYDCSSGSGGAADKYFEMSQPMLKPTIGRYVALNGTPLTLIKGFLGKLEKNQHLILTKTNSKDLSAICDLLQSANMKPILEAKPFTEEDVKAGFQLLKSRRAKGKIVFSISS